MNDFPSGFYNDQQKSIDYLREQLRRLEVRVVNLERQTEHLEVEINKDIHEHVKTLVGQIQTLEKELAQMKSNIRFPIGR